MATAGVFLSMPITSKQLAYSYLPIHLVAILNGVLLLDWLVFSRPLDTVTRVAALAVFLTAGTTLWPKSCALAGALAGIRALARGEEPERRPTGCDSQLIQLVDWGGLRRTVAYLRGSTGPGTRVANLLYGASIAGPAGRLPAFPAESANWLYLAKPDDEAKFVEALRAATDSVLVWRSSRDADESLRAFPLLRAAALELNSMSPRPDSGRTRSGPAGAPRPGVRAIGPSGTIRPGR